MVYMHILFQTCHTVSYQADVTTDRLAQSKQFSDESNQALRRGRRFTEPYDEMADNTYKASILLGHSATVVRKHQPDASALLPKASASGKLWVRETLPEDRGPTPVRTHSPTTSGELEFEDTGPESDV